MFDIGPEPIQYFGYLQGKPAQATEFYNKTRARYWPGTFSILCALLPFAPFIIALMWSRSLLGDALPAPAAFSQIGQTEAAKALFSAFCKSANWKAATLDGLVGSVAHVSATHATFLLAAVLAFVTGVVTAWNVLSLHKIRPIPVDKLTEEIRRGGHGEFAQAQLQTFTTEQIAEMSDRDIQKIIAARLSDKLFYEGLGSQRFRFALRAFAIAAILGSGYIIVGYSLFSDDVRRLFADLNILPPHFDFRDCASFPASAQHIIGNLVHMAKLGVCVVMLAVAALIAAAATLSWRFELGAIDEAWSDTYVLRHKLKSLLTLFFLGSVLLVSSNIALSSLTNTWTAVLSEASAATEAATAAAPEPATTEEKAAAAAAKSAAEALKETVAQAKALRNELLFASGVLGSLLLVAMFTPAFYGLSSEIELAGKTHADNDPPMKAPAQVAVAGFEIVQKWKDKHGLTVSYSQFVSSVVAVLAPVLTGGLIDVGKTLIG